jgi:hypothetical protein
MIYQLNPQHLSVIIDFKFQHNSISQLFFGVEYPVAVSTLDV